MGVQIYITGATLITIAGNLLNVINFRVYTFYNITLLGLMLTGIVGVGMVFLFRDYDVMCVNPDSSPATALRRGDPFRFWTAVGSVIAFFAVILLPTVAAVVGQVRIYREDNRDQPADPSPAGSSATQSSTV